MSDSTLRERIESINLDHLDQVLVGLVDDLHYAKDCYREYLFACGSYPGATLVPTKVIDAVWHGHMADRERYVTDMMAALGMVPVHRAEVYGTPAWEDAYAVTRKLVAYGADMPRDPYAQHSMAGAECYRPPVEMAA